MKTNYLKTDAEDGNMGGTKGNIQKNQKFDANIMLE